MEPGKQNFAVQAVGKEYLGWYENTGDRSLRFPIKLMTYALFSTAFVL